MHFSIYTLTVISALFTTITSQTIDPNEVPLATRDTWCTSQISACPLICTQETDGSAATYANNCDPATLTYSCICSNGLAPNISEYSQTIPYYTCTQFNNDCVNNCGLGNNACANNCRTSNPCGALNPTRVNTTSTSSTSTATATGSSGSGTAVYTGFGSPTTSASSSSSSNNNNNGNSNSNSSSSSKSGAASLAIDLGRIYGLSIVVIGIFTGFLLI